MIQLTVYVSLSFERYKLVIRLTVIITLCYPQICWIHLPNLRVITLNNPRLNSSHPLKLDHGKYSQPNDKNCDGHCRNPEKPLFCAHITYIVCIHAKV